MERTKLKHRVRLVITVTAAEVEEVTGTVVVRVQGGFRQEVTLRHGKAHRQRRGPAGRQADGPTDRYRGSPTVERATRTGRCGCPEPRPLS